MNKKYLVMAGYALSQNDSEIHHVSENKLIKLFGVNPAECIKGDRGLSSEQIADLIVLDPQGGGDYRLPAWCVRVNGRNINLKANTKDEAKAMVDWFGFVNTDKSLSFDLVLSKDFVSPPDGNKQWHVRIKR